MKKLNEKKLIKLYFIIACVQTAIVLIEVPLRRYSGSITTSNLFSFVVETIGVILLNIFMGGCLLDHSKNGRKTYYFTLFLLATQTSMFFNFGNYAVDGITHRTVLILNYIFNALFYLANITVIETFVIYLAYIFNEKSKYLKGLLFAIRLYRIILAILLLINIKTGFVYYFVDGYYIRGNIAPILFTISGIFMVCIIPLFAKKTTSGLETYIYYFYVFMPIGGIALSLFIDGIDFRSVGILSSICILYVHGFVHQNWTLERNNAMLQEQKTAVMISQIQPHFLYNTLSSIAMLCTENPKLAEDTTIKFTRYLRRNMDTLSNNEPILFEQELEHTKTYLEIEKIRFGEKINVIYDIKTKDFLIPALTLQVFAENAVKHGICKKTNGGTITISTREEKDYYMITIIDDGLGFNKEKINWADGTHIGVMNAKSRLYTMMKGTIRIESKENEGTKIFILIPKGEEQ